MFTFGDFARYGRVPVRMLRHYDATGGFTVRDLPAIGQAATIVHRGPMGNVLATIQTLARWIEGNGYRSAGYPRELYLECPADEDK